MGREILRPFEIFLEIGQNRLPFSGIVRTEASNLPEEGISIALDEAGKLHNQHTTTQTANLRAQSLENTATPLSRKEDIRQKEIFEVTADKTTSVDIFQSPPRVANITGEDGRPMPGKCSLIGIQTVDPTLLPREYLFNSNR